MRRSKAPQTLCLILGILIDLIPALYLISNLDFLEHYLLPALFLLLICVVASLPFFLLRHALRRADELQEELDSLKYLKFRMDELLTAYEQGLPPFEPSAAPSEKTE